MHVSSWKLNIISTEEKGKGRQRSKCVREKKCGT